MRPGVIRGHKADREDDKSPRRYDATLATCLAWLAETDTDTQKLGSARASIREMMSDVPRLRFPLAAANWSISGPSTLIPA